MTKSILSQLGFHPAVERWFSERFDESSPPQILGWPKIADGQHTLILAPTGSGKTLAAFLWCIDDLFRSGLNSDAKEFDRNSAGVHTLYISPLKALNNDIHYNLQEPLKGIHNQAQKMDISPPPIRTAVRTGDTPSHVRQAMVKKPPHILITTPESLYLLITSEKGRRIFRNLKYIIVDEIHAVSNNKRGVHLSLSIERLMTLVDKEPTRIGLSATQKPLERTAAYLGGQLFNRRIGRHEPRPVAIVDAGQRKDMDLQVISPVQDWSDLPDASVWPLVIDKLYDLIVAHNTTLVFVNSRAQSERIARQLNEKHRERLVDPDAELTLAHHGSISREMRYDTEEKLKLGQIPSVIATASLELGIDIGSIDLVVQLQSPTSVSSGLQRVGRSGHLMNATSKGRIIPLFQADIDDCVALAHTMFELDIEETTIPENALDVLSQHIVAEVAMKDWPRQDLYHLCRNSYCYRLLSEPAFNNVVDMLAGQFGAAEIRALQPRITWDRINDQLLPRRGSRLMAVMNGGTIADRGYFGVFLEGANKRLGEVEEEFVFESKVGDIFFLGNNEWRISEITRDRIMVSPLGSTKPRAPFWKGEPMFRDFISSRQIGAFRSTVLDLPQDAPPSPATLHSDEDTVVALTTYLQQQREHTDHVPTDHLIVVEYFRDSVGEPQIVLHAPFGGRVLGAWATALSAALEKRYNLEVQFSYDDDGIIFRLIDVDEPPPFEKLLNLPFTDIEKLLTDVVSQTPMFIVRFRHNATRALLLQRSRIDKRIPLWLQRLRASDLLQVVSELPDFPILLETYRDCLQDLFDIGSLKIVLDEIKSGVTKIHYVQTASPSPMTAGLLFRFLSEQMYDYDRFRAAGRAAEISSEMLADILSRDQIPTIISIELVEQAEQRWQFLHSDRRAKDIEDCFQIIDLLGPLTQLELEQRCVQPPQEWTNVLLESGRIFERQDGWASRTSEKFLKIENKAARLQRYFRVRGPATLEAISNSLNINPPELLPLLEGMASEKTIVKGQLLVGVEKDQWCDRENFAHLYRQAVAARRKAHDPGDRNAFIKFQFHWHHLLQPQDSIEEIINQYNGLYFPLHFSEREVLNSRSPLDPSEIKELFQDQITGGEFIPIASKSPSGRYSIKFGMRGGESLFFSSENFDEKTDSLEETSIAVMSFLKENGASPHRDICSGCDLTPIAVDEALMALVRNSLVSCDHLPSFLALLQSESPIEKKPARTWNRDIKQPWSQARRRSTTPRQQIHSRLQQRKGRWILTSSFAVLGKGIEPAKRAEMQARLLLQRYGIIVKEFYRREHGLEPWPRIFHVLKRMEWSGEIRRGYFFEGLSGVQFATHAAIKMIEDISGENEAAGDNLLSTIDPALPFGGMLAWELFDENSQKVIVTRSASNHIYFDGTTPLFYLENFASRVFTLKGGSKDLLTELANHIKNWLRLPPDWRPRKKIEITLIDGQSARKNNYAQLFCDQGFEIDGESLVLWPSKV
jgi:ATP-dependent helicase Lhr and Lhr-like helicase